MNYIYPFTSDCLLSLFELWGGNIRHILNSLSTAVSEVTKERPLQLDRNLLATTLKSVLEKRYLARLQNRMKEVLLEMVKHDEITNKGLSSGLRIARSNVSSYIKDLQSEGLVILKRKNGKDKYWAVEPKVQWNLLKEDKKQSNLNNYVDRFANP